MGSCSGFGARRASEATGVVYLDAGAPVGEANFDEVEARQEVVTASEAGGSAPSTGTIPGAEARRERVAAGATRRPTLRTQPTACSEVTRARMSMPKRR